MPPVRLDRHGDVAELVLDVPPLNVFAHHGTRGTDARTAELTSHLFETRDNREAVRFFLQHGPGNADFTGE
jgi:hypothetical protein